jgi:hypothetical protein
MHALPLLILQFISLLLRLFACAKCEEPLAMVGGVSPANCSGCLGFDKHLSQCMSFRYLVLVKLLWSAP